MNQINNAFKRKTSKEIRSEMGSYFLKQLITSYHFLWSPKGLMLFLGFLLLAAGGALLDQLADNYLIKPVSINFELKGALVYYAFSILGLVLLINQIVLIRNAYTPSFAQIYFWMFFIGIYTIIRFEMIKVPQWNFAPLGNLKVVFILDILYISILLPLFLLVNRLIRSVLAVIQKIRFWLGYQTTSTVFFSEDIPIGCEKNNDISPTYKILGESLANKLSTQVFKYAFSVGIIGPWGSGKSSFINHVLKEAQGNKCGTKVIEVIKFYPAFNHSPEQIINDFFATLIDSLKKYDGRLKSTLLSYSLKLVEATVNKKKDFQTILSPDNYLMRKRPVYKLYEDLSAIIANLPVKPIIVIDDLDRLKAVEILEVLRIIRNTANFPNTVFIVAFDKEFIVQSLQEENKSYSKNYVEKYFQLEMYLPQHKKYNLKENFLKMLEDYIEINNPKDDCSGIIADIKKFIVDEENATINSFITNNREVIKLFNQFVHNIDLLKWEKEIDYIDLLYFTILKSRYSPVIYFLYNNWSKYFVNQNDRWVYDYENIITDNSGTKSADNKLELFLSKSHLDFNISKSNVEELYSLIGELFEPLPLPIKGDEQQERNKKIASRGGIDKRILSVYRTEIFFNLLLSKDELQLVEFSAKLQAEDESKFITFVKEKTNNRANKKVVKAVVRQINNLKYTEIKSLEMFRNAVSCYLFLDEEDRNICDIVSNLSNATYFTNQEIIKKEQDFVEFLIIYIGALGLSNITLKDFFDLWEMIEYSYNNQGNDSDSAYFKWGANTLEGYQPLRDDIVSKTMDELSSSTIDFKQLQFLFESLKSSDIRSKESLDAIMNFGIKNVNKGNLLINHLYNLLDAVNLLEINVISISREIVASLSVKLFLNNSISIHHRLKYFEDAFEGYAEKEYKNEKLGVSSQQEVLEIRNAMVLEFLQQSNANSETAMELCLSQLRLQFDKKLAEEYKFFLLNDANNLKVFIDRSIVQESFSTYTVNRNINDVFRGEQNFFDFLKGSTYSEEPFVLEFMQFYKIDEILHNNFEPRYRTAFNFKIIEAPKSIKPSKEVFGIEFRIFEVLDAILLSYVVDTDKNDLLNLSIDKKYFIFDAKNTGQLDLDIKVYNAGKGIKALGTPGGARVSQNNDKAVMDYGNLKYADKKLYLGKAIIAKEYYYCQYQREI
jgi:hypothetical protein